MKQSMIGAIALGLMVPAMGLAHGPRDRDNNGDDNRGALTRLLVAQGGLDAFQLPDGTDLDAIPADPANPLTDAKVALGKLLFHDTALASAPMQADAAGTYSCASCHHVDAGFQAGVPQGIAEGGTGFGAVGEGRMHNPLYDSTALWLEPDVQPLRSPSAMNAGYQELLLWAGQFGGVGANLGTEAGWTGPLANNVLGFEGVETQAIGGLVAHRMSDMGASPVSGDPVYQAMYAQAFPDEFAPITLINTGLAIAAYERTLLASEAPFQRWLRGERRAMSDAQLRGAILFFGDANCSSCHRGPALNDMAFHALGMADLDEAVDDRVHLARFGGTIPDAVRRGRGGFTGDPSEDYAFKVPQLYNLADSPFYGHGSSFDSIRDVIAYKNAAVPQAGHVPDDALASGFTPLGLTDDEVDDLTTFVTEALYDPDLGRFVPHELPTGSCFPASDATAYDDLGCGLDSVSSPLEDDDDRRDRGRDRSDRQDRGRR